MSAAALEAFQQNWGHTKMLRFFTTVSIIDGRSTRALWERWYLIESPAGLFAESRSHPTGPQEVNGLFQTRGVLWSIRNTECYGRTSTAEGMKQSTVLWFLSTFSFSFPYAISRATYTCLWCIIFSKCSRTVVQKYICTKRNRFMPYMDKKRYFT